MFTRSRAFIIVNRDIFKGRHVVTNLNRTQWSAKFAGAMDEQDLAVEDAVVAKFAANADPLIR